MSRYVFGTQELPILLRQESQQFSTGYLRIHLKSLDGSDANETWLLAFLRGRLLFSSDQVLNAKSFLKMLTRSIPRLNSAWSQRAVQVVQERLMREDSLQDLIEGMTQLALIKPGEVEDALWTNLMTDLDRYLYTRAGTCRFEFHDILYKDAPIVGFELDPVLRQAAERRDQWAALKTVIPTLKGVPIVNWDRVNRLKVTEEQRQKLHSLTDENYSIEAIAAKLGKDQLEVAQLFASWMRKGLVTLQSAVAPRLQARMTILAVDDSIVMQEMIRLALPDYRVITTGNPSELLSLLFLHRPDLLVLDVTMPGIDGLDLCRFIRGIDEFKTLPVIMLTARDGLFDRLKGKWSGATAYMTKPFNEVQLNYEVQRLLAERKRDRASTSMPEQERSVQPLPPEWTEQSAFKPSTGL